MNPIAIRLVILVAAFAVIFTAAQPFLPVPASETAHAADFSAPPASQVDDPRVLYLFSQMEMALGDIDSAVRLADRASRVERNLEREAPQPAEGIPPCNNQSRNLRAQARPLPQQGYRL
ncbi:MAG TPA: hypothetical protein VNK82_09885 [Terriglobales bacterium]|nr:hypothetical protein [Terriglobales bacterium]